MAGDGQARQLLATKLIPTVTGLKRVNDTEIRQAAGSNDLPSQLNRWTKAITSGGMTEKDYQNVLKTLGVAKKASDSAYSGAMEIDILRNVHALLI